MDGPWEREDKKEEKEEERVSLKLPAKMHLIPSANALPPPLPPTSLQGKEKHTCRNHTL